MAQHEIRLRQVPKELMKQAEQIQAWFNTNTITGAIERAIGKFLTDQDTIKELRNRVAALERSNEHYRLRETHCVEMINHFRAVLNQDNRYLKNLDNDAIALLKRFNKTTKKKGTKKKPAKNRVSRSARPGKKKSHSPKRKGGKK